MGLSTPNASSAAHYFYEVAAEAEAVPANAVSDRAADKAVWGAGPAPGGVQGALLHARLEEPPPEPAEILQEDERPGRADEPPAADFRGRPCSYITKNQAVQQNPSDAVPGDMQHAGIRQPTTSAENKEGNKTKAKNERFDWIKERRNIQNQLLTLGNIQTEKTEHVLF